MHPVGLEVKAVLAENKKACVELSGNLPFVSHDRVVNRRVSLSNFRRFIGYSDQQYDDATAASQSTLRANPSHDPAQSANIDDPQSRIESRMMPGKAKRFHLVPHLLGLETALQCKHENSIEKTFDWTIKWGSPFTRSALPEAEVLFTPWLLHSPSSTHLTSFCLGSLLSLQESCGR